MPPPNYLGATPARLGLYLPHRPNQLAQLVAAPAPSPQALIAANSNHWRKIVTLLAKVACPTEDDWRTYRDGQLFQDSALCFSPRLSDAVTWHWIGGKDNLARFQNLHHRAQPLPGSPTVLIDPDKRLLLTPYPDYRQLSNEVVSQLRSALGNLGFY